MNSEEYNKQKERVRQYNLLDARLGRLGDYADYIDNGLLDINCAYQNKIKFEYEYDDEFKKNLVKAIRNEIDKEYRKVEEMKNIL